MDKSASAADIKKAYYGLAKKYHPDTNKEPAAKEKFAAAQSAYEILSDPEKKQAYDSHGAAAFDQSGGFSPGGGPGGPSGSPFGGFGFGFGGQQGGFSADINIEDLFSAFTGAQGQKGATRSRETVVGDDVEIQVNISFMDAAKGTNKDIQVRRLVSCQTCKGSGLKKDAKRTECKSCRGTGQRVTRMAGFQMAVTCNTCDGSGTSVPRGSSCSACGGEGAVRERKTVVLEIPGGVEDGMRMKLAREGDAPLTGRAAGANVSGINGDLFVLVRVAADSRFKRNGSDILHTVTIPLTTAVLGGEIKVPSLEKDITVKVPTGTGTGDKVTMSGMGMKQLGGRRATTGDLKVEFKVRMPQYLTVNQRAILEMLADEMNDKSARRFMNTGQDKAKAGQSAVKDGQSADAHKNEGFLKAAWHNLTGQHQPQPEEKDKAANEGESKKASESS